MIGHRRPVRLPAADLRPGRDPRVGGYAAGAMEYELKLDHELNHQLDYQLDYQLDHQLDHESGD